MIGWLVAWKCLVACLFFESSQQPTCPQVRQRRRCTQLSPIFKQSSHPLALGVTSRIWSRWLHCCAICFCSPSLMLLDALASFRKDQRLPEQISLHVNYLGKKITWVQEHDQACVRAGGACVAPQVRSPP